MSKSSSSKRPLPKTKADHISLHNAAKQCGLTLMSLQKQFHQEKEAAFLIEYCYNNRKKLSPKKSPPDNQPPTDTRPPSETRPSSPGIASADLSAPQIWETASTSTTSAVRPTEQTICMGKMLTETGTLNWNTTDDPVSDNYDVNPQIAMLRHTTAPKDMVHYYLLKFNQYLEHDKVLGQATIAKYTAKVEKFLVKYHNNEDIWLLTSPAGVLRLIRMVEDELKETAPPAKGREGVWTIVRHFLTCLDTRSFLSVSKADLEKVYAEVQKHQSKATR